MLRELGTMRNSGHHRGLVVTAMGALLVGLGIALALAGKPTADKPGARPAAAKKTLDCRVLEKQLSQCGPAIAAAFDAGLGARLAKHPPLLRGALLRTISQEFVARVAAPCFSRRGILKQGDALQACLTAAKTAAKPCPPNTTGAAAEKCRTAGRIERCRTFARCLAAKVRALPRPAPRPATKAAPTKK
jgi:hypothetical protein